MAKETVKLGNYEEEKKRKWKHKSLLVWQILLENTDENHAMPSGWLCEFGKKATVISPLSVVNDMKEYVKGILERYE